MLTQEAVAALFEYRGGGLYWRISLRYDLVVGSRAGTLKQNGYREVMVEQKKYKEHRLVYLLHHGVMPKYIDHINGVRDDNRIENLRPCTLQQNAYNMKRPKRNTSGVKGVSWSKAAQKWVAYVRADGVQHYLGLYSTIEDAAQAVNATRQFLHSEFANKGV